MCQGLIVSLVKFKSKGRTRSVVLSGVGSHSQLLSDNRARLKRLGWTGSPSDRVFSIESDFSAWNKFTIESGDPNRNELALLKKEYKRIGGSAKALIAHVKRVGKIDDALVNLLSEQALAEYEKVKQQAWQPAWAEYEKVMQQAWMKLFSIKSNRVPRLQ